ncbi:transmembrane protein, putative (macronuclear) [Tetrahymena thermophila SB210]|uniref:Transmembrane protein, putative n=1 Tax=Tetrahymena thermophila (strain SB210) TaxID=312017 RepID=W7XCE3_TETTS|nr:transmembrane protein, putative [Tetrahymena thermophila SB210]EWS71421.1 transmembrane protein, putative [Tetrahymena thermophila SB210]|eukprot:XP_012656041.1 transmembrane protein, putative [Tetrahymena thermophila SB210]
MIFDNYFLYFKCIIELYFYIVYLQLKSSKQFIFYTILQIFILQTKILNQLFNLFLHFFKNLIKKKKLIFYLILLIYLIFVSQIFIFYFIYFTYLHLINIQYLILTFLSFLFISFYLYLYFYLFNYFYFIYFYIFYIFIFNWLSSFLHNDLLLSCLNMLQKYLYNNRKKKLSPYYSGFQIYQIFFQKEVLYDLFARFSLLQQTYVMQINEFKCDKKLGSYYKVAKLYFFECLK